jgi:hypothetical protein
MVHDEAVALEIGQVLADRVGRYAEVRRDRFGAGAAFAPNELPDLQAGRAARDHRRHMSGFAAELNTLTDLLQVMLDKIPGALKLYGGEI